MAEVKIGIVGFGFMGHCHADMLKTIDDIKLVAVADTNSNQLKEIPEGIKTYSCIDDMLADADINTVIISTPNPSHLEMVEKSANAKKNIICEKPAAMSVAQFDQMIKAAKQNNVIFTVHQQRRWDKDYQIMKKVYDNRLVGDMYIIKSQLYGVNGNMHDWHVFPEMGGGMLFDWGVHLIDQILDMVDSEVDSLYADVRNVINKDVDDYFKIILKFKNKVMAEIELGTYYLTPKRAWFIGGNKGSALIDGFHGEGKIVRTAHLLENVPGKITMTAAGPTRSFGPPEPGLLKEEPLPEVNVSHRDYFTHFVKAFKKEEELVIKADQVRRVLSVMDAVRKSAKTGEAIRFECKAR
ncbi:Gfo/Idh/MocA family protein [Anaerocolumna sp. MB42-C2]|uniref:Gfo/Idh/MocA family protein n=1 Tax=Anaerocolumna sp. MB42-C2 TaxID=3070997 RepID=UPI0027DECE98|nr:Gfo/Idh/MocA family oxidoreductase [Anaerocolumna sp. MB42-C2]WMJ90119.1 Gfo/Idh/MocA family oxidoreductase [Anaerocolumna sp. MB42-C2]